MGLATRIRSSTGAPLPLGEAAKSLYVEVLKRHPELGKKDFSSVFMFLKRAAEKGQQVRLGEIIDS